MTIISDSDLQEFGRLLSQENDTLWQQGDWLLGHQLDSAALEKVADKFQRSVKTLQERERVAREYSKTERDPNMSWAVHAISLGIPNKEARLEVVRSRPGREWTTAAMHVAVRSWNKELRRETSVRNTQFRGGMRLGEVVIRGELSDKGVVRITLDAVLEETAVHVIGGEVTQFTGRVV